MQTTARIKNYQRILACPKCRASLNIDSEKLFCVSPSCHSEFLFKDGIPVMLLNPLKDVIQTIDQVVQNPNEVMFQKKFLGIPVFKIDYWIKQKLYQLFKIRFPKLKSQHMYWLRRGKDYCSDFLKNGYENLEIFFQDMLIDELRGLDFESFFEAGCGFGWNVRRVKREFPEKFVGGLDFSHTQLSNALNVFLEGTDVTLTEGDATRMPFVDNAFDVGFSLGVFMNIHPSKIGVAIDEMVRVCRKYVIHLEYDENHAVPELRERRAFKTNIVSHPYEKLYKERGLKIRKFLTYSDFGSAYERFFADAPKAVNRWENWEGPSKYIFIVAEKQSH
jgi:ubiquinone/menaquinone biosynthesis C-methylase UbiE/uncharacterized protein YbaR (Trm112 family)